MGWENHRNARDDTRLEKISTWLGTNASANGRLHQAAWDKRGMDAVAGEYRSNKAPRPGKGGSTRSVSAELKNQPGDRAAIRAAKRAERENRNNATALRKTAEGIEKQRAILDDPKASDSQKRAAKRAVDRGRRDAQRMAKRVPNEYTRGIDESTWKRR